MNFVIVKYVYPAAGHGVSESMLSVMLKRTGN